MPSILFSETEASNFAGRSLPRCVEFHITSVRISADGGRRALHQRCLTGTRSLGCQQHIEKLQCGSLFSTSRSAAAVVLEGRDLLERWRRGPRSAVLGRANNASHCSPSVLRNQHDSGLCRLRPLCHLQPRLTQDGLLCTGTLKLAAFQ